MMFLMKAAGVILIWLLLLAVCWPLALAAIVLVPFLWLVSLPFRLVFWVVEAVLGFMKGVIFLPARLLGFRG